MKKVLAVVAAVGCLAAATSALGGVGATTGVNGSLHDMTRFVPATADAMGRVCVYCHAPHHAKVTMDTTADGANDTPLPLWNHKINNDTFTPYTWATPLNATATITDPLIGPSRLCMSCHDGVTAVDEHGSTYNGTLRQDPGTRLTGRADLNTDLSDTHPIGFDYITIAATRNAAAHNGEGDDTEIVNAEKGFAIAITEHDHQDQGYNAVTRDNSGRKIKDVLYQETYMTCATCHEVHNKENVTQMPYNSTLWGDNGIDNVTIPDVLDTTQAAPNYFLYAQEFKSLICLSCHIK